MRMKNHFNYIKVVFYAINNPYIAYLSGYFDL